MGTYAESLLTPDEKVLRRERQHPIALVLDSWLAIIFWGATAILLVVKVLLPHEVFGWDLFGEGTWFNEVGTVVTWVTLLGGVDRRGRPLVVVADTGVPRHEPAPRAGLGRPQQEVLRQLAREDQRRAARHQRPWPDARLRQHEGHDGGAHGRIGLSRPTEPCQGVQEGHDDRQARAADRRARRRRRLPDWPAGRDSDERRGGGVGPGRRLGRQRPAPRRHPRRGDRRARAAGQAARRGHASRARSTRPRSRSSWGACRAPSAD